MSSAVLIGYGSVGRYHAAILEDRFESLAVIDTGPERLELAASEHPNAILESSADELDRKGWDWNATLGVIATWGPTHSAIFSDLAGLGVKKILCEKPLAHSVHAGAKMVRQAKELGIVLGTHHHSAYSGFVQGLGNLAEKYDLGRPYSMVVHGGAQGLVTNGIHWIDTAYGLFDGPVRSVSSLSVGQPINPRSPNLLFYGGTSSWMFGDDQQLTISFSNASSVAMSVSIYYRDAVVNTNPHFHAELRHREKEELDRFPSVTRVGEPTSHLYSGEMPEVMSVQDRTRKIIDEIETGHLTIRPPETALDILGATIGGVAAAERGKTLSLPIDADSDLGRREWPIS